MYVDSSSHKYFGGRFRSDRVYSVFSYIHSVYYTNLIE